MTIHSFIHSHSFIHYALTTHSFVHLFRVTNLSPCSPSPPPPVVIREPILQEKRAEHVQLQRDALELVELVSGKSKRLPGADTDITMDTIHRANVVAQTRIHYNEKQLLQLMHNHLVSKVRDVGRTCRATGCWRKALRIVNIVTMCWRVLALGTEVHTVCAVSGNFSWSQRVWGVLTRLLTSKFAMSPSSAAYRLSAACRVFSSELIVPSGDRCTP